jgi:transposase InsO family protein
VNRGSIDKSLIEFELASNSQQYMSLAFGRRRERGIVSSMGTIGDCLDNVAAESFFSALKTELLSPGSLGDARRRDSAIVDYIEGSTTAGDGTPPSIMSCGALRPTSSSARRRDHA